MKYTLWNVVQEKALGEQDAESSAGGPESQVVRFGSKRQWLAGTRPAVFLAHGRGRGVVDVATPLGHMSLSLLKGDQGSQQRSQSGGKRSIKSSMPGRVVRILVKPGETVSVDQPLLILEAMKMENEIRSPVAGVVVDIPLEPGQKIETGVVMVVLQQGESS